MGSWFRFTCSKCGYGAEVSGGKDCGMLAVVQTMICQDCAELVDVLIGQCGNEGMTGDADYDEGIGICPECNGPNVVVWLNRVRPCPKCDGRMTKGQCIALWD